MIHESNRLGNKGMTECRACQFLSAFISPSSSRNCCVIFLFSLLHNFLFPLFCSLTINFVRNLINSLNHQSRSDAELLGEVLGEEPLYLLVDDSSVEAFTVTPMAATEVQRALSSDSSRVFWRWAGHGAIMDISSLLQADRDGPLVVFKIVGTVLDRCLRTDGLAIINGIALSSPS